MADTWPIYLIQTNQPNIRWRLFLRQQKILLSFIWFALWFNTTAYKIWAAVQDSSITTRSPSKPNAVQGFFFRFCFFISCAMTLCWFLTRFIGLDALLMAARTLLIKLTSPPTFLSTSESFILDFQLWSSPSCLILRSLCRPLEVASELSNLDLRFESLNLVTYRCSGLSWPGFYWCLMATPAGSSLQTFDGIAYVFTWVFDATSWDLS